MADSDSPFSQEASGWANWANSPAGQQAAQQTDNAPSQATSGGILDSAMNILDPGNARKQISGLFSGGAKGNKNKAAAGKSVVSSSAAPKDWRVRISVPAKSGLSYGADNPLLNILTRTGGVIFPYTPTITLTHNARYQEQALTHSNYKNYFYEGSDVSAINIVGDFTVQNKDDALYLLAAIYFFRSATKMFYGKDSSAGNPPPIVYLDGYGDYYFPHVSCVVTSFQHTMPADCDYMEVSYSQGQNSALTPPGAVGGGKSGQIARLPTISQLNLTVQPIYSRTNIYNNMSLTKFSQGQLLKGNGGFL